MFKPGALSAAEAAELNRLAQLVRDLTRMTASPPLFITAAGAGPKVIGIDSAAASGTYWLWVSGDNNLDEPDTRYSYYPAEWTIADGWRPIPDASEVLYKLVRAPTGEPTQQYRYRLQPGDVVRAWVSPTEPGYYECQDEFRDVVKGYLDTSLTFGGSATLSVWEWNGSSEVDTGVNITVYDWLLSSGQSVSSGLKATAAYMGGRYYLTGARCP